jgi:hypothetical protein
VRIGGVAGGVASCCRYMMLYLAKGLPMKRSAFEDLLQTSFRWPTQGDVAFVAATDPADNAVVALEAGERLMAMVRGYKKGSDLMVASATENPTDRDDLVNPIIFNYRQFLELSLKYLISAYGPTVGVEENWKTHDLGALWQAFARVLVSYGTPDPDKADPVVEAVMAEFSKIDPDSYSHRYPYDKKGRPLPIATTDLHLPTLADVMKSVENYFIGCDIYLAEVKFA